MAYSLYHGNESDSIEITNFAYSLGELDFLSPERQQKYELLLHLLANLRQPLLLSGPEGIGKSTFLAQLRDHPPPGWQVFLLNASQEANLDQVRRALIERPQPAQVGRGQQRITVLALDGAGWLIPGALDEICRFVAQMADVRLVAALRPDELHLKAVSDPWAVGEAQVIELPPLTEEQCADYLNRLWVQRGKSGEPDPELVRDIYRRTYGVPARIQEEMLDLFGRPPLRWHLTMAKPVYVSLMLLVAAVVAVTYWQAEGQNEKKPESSPQETALNQPDPTQPVPPALDKKPASQEVSVSKSEEQAAVPPASSAPDPALQTAQVPDASAQSMGEAKDEDAEQTELVAVSAPSLPSEKVAVEDPRKPEPKEQEKVTEPPKRAASTPISQVEELPPKQAASVPLAETQPAPAPERPKVQDAALEAAKAAGIQPREWVLKRPPEHFALQIGFFRDPKALAAFAQRHPKLRPLTYYPKGNGYVLLYGSFRSIDEVQQATRKLPPEIGQASIWRFKSVQDAVRSQPHSSIKEPS
ncbi:MAG: SPOR domain-containing protein [Methylohalobius sp.]|nr:SPOR domain-containing protein [Methylohalobius sp.]